jgi:uncharacterized protein (TIGR02284 family)
MDNKTVETLQRLVHICRDGQKGFRDYGQELHDPAAKQFFLQESANRAKFAGDLEAELHRLGQHDVDNSVSTTTPLYHTWTEIKAKLGGGDHAYLEGAELGEDYARKAYEEAMQQKLLGDIQAIVQQQLESIRRVHDHVKSLRDISKAA